MLECPSAEWRFSMATEFKSDVLDVCSDSDWAGCKATRKSTSGGMFVVDGCRLRSWSSTQATVASSSGEAALYAPLKAAAEGLGFQAVACDLGVELRAVLWVDSSTAQSISSRNGVGKTKHVEVKFLWIQEVVRGSRVVVQRVAGDRNPADLLTKPHSACRIGEVVSWVGGRILRRRCGPPSRIRWADVVEHEESDSADVWLTVDPRRESTEGNCWEYSTHPVPFFVHVECVSRRSTPASVWLKRTAIETVRVSCVGCVVCVVCCVCCVCVVCVLCVCVVVLLFLLFMCCVWCSNQEQRAKIFKESRTGPQTLDTLTDDGEARNDFWTIAGNYICRHHVEPRGNLCAERRIIPKTTATLTWSGGRIRQWMCCWKAV